MTIYGDGSKWPFIWGYNLWSGVESEFTLLQLQSKANLIPFRRCEIKRRYVSGYESSFLDVSKYVTQWPAITFDTDSVIIGKWRRGTADLVFRNDGKQFADESMYESLFGGSLTQYKTLVKISTGLVDKTSMIEFPSSSSIFFGLVSDATIGESETRFVCNDLMQSLAEFQASNIAPSVTGLTLTAVQIIQTIRDYTDSSSQTILGQFITSTAWQLTSTGRFYTIPTTSSLQGITALDVIEKLAVCENHQFFMGASGNLKFSPRKADSTVSYEFRGAGLSDVNILSFDGLSDGVKNVYTKITFQLSSNAFVTTQQTFNVGDNSSSWKYGQREFEFSTDWVTTATAGSISSQLLADFAVPKKEVELSAKYITQLELLNRVTLKYYGMPTGDKTQWNNFTWGQAKYSGFNGGIYLNQDFYVTSIMVDMENFKTKFKLRST